MRLSGDRVTNEGTEKVGISNSCTKARHSEHTPVIQSQAQDSSILLTQSKDSEVVQVVQELLVHDVLIFGEGEEDLPDRVAEEEHQWSKHGTAKREKGGIRVVSARTHTYLPHSLSSLTCGRPSCEFSVQRYGSTRKMTGLGKTCRR